MNLCMEQQIIVESPIGLLRLASNGSALTRLDFERPGAEFAAVECSREDDQVLALAREQLNAYFDGDLREFRLPLAFECGTEFQRRVWEALQIIPYGETFSYQAIAKSIGNTAAVRAVGGAIGKNPIAIVFPCHRVIGTNGALTGFGGGLDRKRWLLDHERVLREQDEAEEREMDEESFEEDSLATRPDSPVLFPRLFTA